MTRKDPMQEKVVETIERHNGKARTVIRNDKSQIEVNTFAAMREGILEDIYTLMSRKGMEKDGEALNGKYVYFRKA